jgi:hypothetical protein
MVFTLIFNNINLIIIINNKNCKINLPTTQTAFPSLFNYRSLSLLRLPHLFCELSPTTPTIDFTPPNRSSLSLVPSSTLNRDPPFPFSFSSASSHLPFFISPVGSFCLLHLELSLYLHLLISWCYQTSKSTTGAVPSAMRLDPTEAVPQLVLELSLTLTHLI